LLDAETLLDRTLQIPIRDGDMDTIDGSNQRSVYNYSVQHKLETFVSKRTQYHTHIYAHLHQ